jgi:hypothetical protein
MTMVLTDPPVGDPVGDWFTGATNAINAMHVHEACCSGAKTIGTSLEDVTGASVTFTTTTAGAYAHVVWVADHSITGASAGVIAIVQLNVDGATDSSRQLLCSLDDTRRITVMQQAKVSLPDAGSHTIKLQCQKTGAGGTDQLQAGHTNLTVVVYENV